MNIEQTIEQVTERQDPEFIIIPNEKGNPPGKLADVELHFHTGVFAGLKLIGFSIWERRGGSGKNVTMPARQYSVNGERRSFALLRPTGNINHDPKASDTLRDLIIEAYFAWHQEQDPHCNCNDCLDAHEQKLAEHTPAL